MRLLYRCLCLVLGAVLGSGCSNPNEPVEYGPQPEYGVPTGTIRIDGRVVNEMGGTIPGVEVSFYGVVADTSDADGHWSIDRRGVPIPCAGSATVQCQVVGTDIDGPDNGGPFPATTVPLSLTRTVPGDGNWDLGTWEQSDIEVMMWEPAEYGPPIARLPRPAPPDAPQR